jgi:FtsP/CotA-like multicopper oxidase with cupredoxin domain
LGGAAVAALTLALIGGLCGPAAAATGGSDCHEGAPPLIHDGFPEPELRYSRNGKLETSIRASVSPVTINGQRVDSMNYDGSYPGPALVICAGDKLTVHFANDLLQPTNLHMHGFHVSPSGHSDNVYLDLQPGQRFTYSYDIPEDMSPGTYWYHPHRHMYVDPQIYGGMAGAVVQEGGLDELPALRDVPQRWMVLQYTQVKDGKVVPVDDEVDADAPLLVNGVQNPTAKIRPGQIQRWRIFNADADRFVIFEIPGARFQVLAQDGNTLARPRMVSQIVLPPGGRREVLVRGRRGTHVMKTRPFAQFPGGETVKGGGPQPNQAVVTMKSSGKPAHDSFLEGSLSKPIDLRDRKVDRRRRIVFSEQGLPNGLTAFELNGHTFDPNRVITMKLNSVEEWTLVNATTEWHTFHIHINPFQVVSVGGKERPYVDYEDNVAIPPKKSVVIRQHPIDFTGKFVLHCHVVFHEDHGMMAAVQVLKNPTKAQLSASISREDGLTVSSGAYGDTTPVALTPATGAFAVLCLLGDEHQLAWRREDEVALSAA